MRDVEGWIEVAAFDTLERHIGTVESSMLRTIVRRALSPASAPFLQPHALSMRFSQLVSLTWLHLLAR